MFFSRQENADRCRDQSKGRQTDKAPFKGVDGHPHNGGFRGAVIPAQIASLLLWDSFDGPDAPGIYGHYLFRG